MEKKVKKNTYVIQKKSSLKEKQKAKYNTAHFLIFNY